MTANGKEKIDLRNIIYILGLFYFPAMFIHALKDNFSIPTANDKIKADQLIQHGLSLICAPGFALLLGLHHVQTPIFQEIISQNY
jgi:hypothetical protein